MVGRGESATVVLADRKIAGVHHSMVMFELSRSAHLDGFFVRPDDGDALQLQWRGPRATWNDQRALSMGARVMYNLATVGDRAGAEPLGLEVQGERVWVHTRTRLRGEDLERFVDDAMRLRAMLVRSLDRAHTATSSGSAGSRSVGSRPRPPIVRDVEVTVPAKG